MIKFFTKPLFYTRPLCYFSINSKVFLPKTPLDFKDKSHIPIHINTKSDEFGKMVVKSFTFSFLPLVAYSIIYYTVGYWSKTMNNLIICGLLLQGIMNSSKIVKMVDKTVKELHIDKNGKDLIMVIDRGVLTSYKSYKKQDTKKDFTPNHRQTRFTTLFLRFSYDNIESVKYNEKDQIMILKINIEGSVFDAEVDFKNHDGKIPLEYVMALKRSEMIGI